MFRHNALRYMALVLLAAGALFQAFTAEYFGLEILTEILILAMLVLALDIVAGLGGMVSLCHGALMGVGAYAYAILSAKAGLAPPVPAAGQTQRPWPPPSKPWWPIALEKAADLCDRPCQPDTGRHAAIWLKAISIRRPMRTLWARWRCPMTSAS